MGKKVWHSIKVQCNISSQIDKAIDEALQALTDAGFEPAFVTSVGSNYDAHVIVSGFFIKEEV